MKIVYITTVLLLVIISLLLIEIKSNRDKAKAIVVENILMYNEWQRATIEIEKIVKEQFISHDTVFEIKHGKIKSINGSDDRNVKINNYVNGLFGRITNVSCETDGTSNILANYNCYLIFETGILVLPIRVIKDNKDENEYKYITELNMQIFKVDKYGMMNSALLPDSIAYDRCDDRFRRFEQYNEFAQREKANQAIQWLNDTDYLFLEKINKRKDVLKYVPLIIDSIKYDSTYNSKLNFYNIKRVYKYNGLCL
jgi:hypothetical protein